MNGSARLDGIPAFDFTCIDDGLPRRLVSNFCLRCFSSALFDFEQWLFWVVPGHG
jgi:hypothetical protein